MRRGAGTIVSFLGKSKNFNNSFVFVSEWAFKNIFQILSPEEAKSREKKAKIL